MVREIRLGSELTAAGPAGLAAEPVLHSVAALMAVQEPLAKEVVVDPVAVVAAAALLFAGRGTAGAVAKAVAAHPVVWARLPMPVLPPGPVSLHPD